MVAKLDAKNKRSCLSLTSRKRPHTKTVKTHKSKHSRKKLRIGIIVGKNFDPIPRGTQDRCYPDKFKIMNNTGPGASGWGGMFQIDTSVALKMARLHPDILHIDLIRGKEVTAARLKRNHLNFNLFYDVVMAQYGEGKARAREIRRLFQDSSCRMWPSFDFYDWVCTKPHYMKQCQKAGIPMIETIFVEDGLKPDKLLRQIKARGWQNCFIKSGAYVCFGNCAIHGRVQDWVDNPSLLQTFAKDNAGEKCFLVQPYTLKPNGCVFDEVRNFFIDGKWRYSVYTDGTDDDAVYEQPNGPLKDACRRLSQRVYQEVQKVAKWEGKATAPLMCRIDVGVLPDKSTARGFRVFLNEIECEISTWLPRYCPFNLCDAVAEAAVRKVAELLEGLLHAGRRLPEKRALIVALPELQARLARALQKT
eukprot:TRINITY_DN22982_c0_g1_i1.p1 TRINITY_DN22982_c0_g1~~TRINITY_DN22982_c0_g1_i1.p1  ORF type:complete len:450 (-),score=55.77 TRINITY_DN22982_c0_g1_i1:237-1493(-)